MLRFLFFASLEAKPSLKSIWQSAAVFQAITCALYVLAFVFFPFKSENWAYYPSALSLAILNCLGIWGFGMLLAKGNKNVGKAPVSLLLAAVASTAVGLGMLFSFTWLSLDGDSGMWMALLFLVLGLVFPVAFLSNAWHRLLATPPMRAILGSIGAFLWLLLTPIIIYLIFGSKIIEYDPMNFL